MKNLTIIFTLFLASTVTFAQEAYKCKVNGSLIIQDAPCKAEAPRPKVQDVPASAETIEKVSQLCSAAVRSQMKDPESARIKDIRRGEVSEWCTKPRTPVRYYWMTVNGKNSYGGYVGEKPYRCAMNIGETLVLSIAQISETEKILPCK